MDHLSVTPKEGDRYPWTPSSHLMPAAESVAASPTCAWIIPRLRRRVGSGGSRRTVRAATVRWSGERRNIRQPDEFVMIGMDPMTCIAPEVTFTATSSSRTLGSYDEARPASTRLEVGVSPRRARAQNRVAASWAAISLALPRLSESGRRGSMRVLAFSQVIGWNTCWYGSGSRIGLMTR
jgi:hypothetical protein